MRSFFKCIITFSLFLFPVSCGIFSKKQTFIRKKQANIPLIERYIRKELQSPLKQTFSELKSQKGNNKTKVYIKKYAATALREMIAYGIPASITLAQGILESRSGLSELSRKSNNHFGIKCHSGWQGAFVRYDDDALQECFRKYKNPQDSYKDHSFIFKN